MFQLAVASSNIGNIMGSTVIVCEQQIGMLAIWGISRVVGGEIWGDMGELEYKTYFPYKTLVYLNVWVNVDLGK